MSFEYLNICFLNLSFIMAYLRSLFLFPVIFILFLAILCKCKCGSFHRSSCCWHWVLNFPTCLSFSKWLEHFSWQRDQQALKCLSPFCLLSSTRSTLPVFNLHFSDSQYVGHRSKAVKQLGCLLKFRFLDSILKKGHSGGSDLAFLQ